MEVIVVLSLFLFVAYLKISDFIKGLWHSNKEDARTVDLIIPDPEPKLPTNNFLEDGERSHLFLNLSKNRNGPNIPKSVKKTLRSLAMTGALKRTKTRQFVPYSRIPQDILNAHRETLKPHIRRLNVTYKVGGSPIQEKHVLLGDYFNGQMRQPEAWYHIHNPIPNEED